MYDLLILGGGPAGLTAGIYAARGGLSCAVIESKAVGGQAALTSEIENYPGFKSVSGFELTSLMQAQCEGLGVQFVYDNPVKVSLDGKIKSVETEYSGTLSAPAIVIATGALPRPLGVERESALIGGGVSYCATCDGAFSGVNPWWWSAAETPRSRTRCISCALPPKSASCTAATSCARERCSQTESATPA